MFTGHMVRSVAMAPTIFTPATGAIHATKRYLTMPKCVICNKEVKPGTEHKARYTVHAKCFKRVVPSAKEQKIGDEVV